MKHKTAIASAASIAGVLLAGATALGANLGIVNSSDQLGELSAVSETVATQPTVPGTSTTTEAGPDLIAYQIPEVGIVTIARSDDQLSVDSADVGSWTYEVVDTGSHLEIMFSQNGREVKFEASVDDDQVDVEVSEEETIVTQDPPSTDPSTSTTTPGSSTSSSDHDDDDSYEDDDHDSDDDHEDDDHDGGDDDD